ncbi:MAG: AAA family ATPase, partial [Pseudomonadota bacterium]|nr:AAA family ATPase [Pseudomonadota bacterium]
MVMGGPGSGKSTLARRLGTKLDLPVTHLDALYHG